MLAVSDVCHLTNYYNGTVTRYIAYKDSSKICIDRLFETDTTEDNGLEVDVLIKEYSRDKYGTCKTIAKSLFQLLFYDNVYIDDSDCILYDNTAFLADVFNNRKIKEFKTFKLCSNYDINNELLMGNVVYPINTDIIAKWFKGHDYVPFAIKCDIGDVDVTPSREQLLYSTKTIDTINKKCQEVLEELKEFFSNNFNGDFQTLAQLYHFNTYGKIDFTLAEFDDSKIEFSIYASDMSYYDLSDKITYKGQPVSKSLIKYYESFRMMSLPNWLLIYQYYNKKFYTKNVSLNIYRFIDCCEQKQIYLTDGPLKPIAKQYFVHKNLGSWKTLYFLNIRYIRYTFKQLLTNFCKAYNLKPTNKDIKIIYHDFIDTYNNFPTYNNSDVPQSFIDASKPVKTKNNTQQKPRKCVIYRLVQGRSYNSVTYETNELNVIKKYKGTIFFAEKDNTYIEEFYKWFRDRVNLNCSSKLMFVTVAPTNLPILRELKNTVEFNSIFTKKNNVISDICTRIYLVEKYNIHYCEILKLEGNASFIDKLSDYIYKLYCMNNSLNYADGDIIKELLTSLCTIYYKNGWLKYDMIDMLDSNQDFVKLNYFLHTVNYDKTECIMTLYFYLTNLKRDKRHQIEMPQKLNNLLKPILDEYTPNSKLPHFNIG